MANQIMIVDDETNILSAMSRALDSLPSTDIEIFEKPADALKRARTTIFDVFLVDYQMPGMNGVELLSQIKMLQPDSVRMIVSGKSDKSSLIEAINHAEIYRFIEKPWNNRNLIHEIEKALIYRKALQEKRILFDQMRQLLM